MLKNIAWNTFKKTGSIDTFLELRKIDEIGMKQINDKMQEEVAEEFVKKDLKVKKDGTNEDKRSSNCRE